MKKEVKLTLPVTEEQVRELNCGDIVYLSGSIYTMRDMGHRRAVEMLKSGQKLPFDLASGAVWHCGPIVRPKDGDRWEVMSAGSTTSSRFTTLGSELIRMLNMRCTIGKGTMNQEAVDTMKKAGSVFLNTTGGCAALYAQQIEELAGVYWKDLGLPEATWVMKIKDMGPLIVGIDSHGNSLYRNISVGLRELLDEQFEKSGISREYRYSYLPKRVAGKDFTAKPG